MSGAITVSDPIVDEMISFTEEIGARSPGWFKAECDRCEVYTTGGEHVVQDWAYEHVLEHRRWKVYKQYGGYWNGLWIAQPPGGDFEGSYAFRSFRRALQYASEQAQVPA